MTAVTGSVSGAGGKLTGTIEIKRAETGQVEYYQMVGFVNPDDLAKLIEGGTAEIGVSEASSGLTRSVDEADLIDQTAIIDQDTVTSTVKVDGSMTIRTYSDGTVQRNAWDSPEAAQEFADSVGAN